ncbi:3196_t:CDS:2, partial [Funneliformis caledonium]
FKPQDGVESDKEFHENCITSTFRSLVGLVTVKIYREVLETYALSTFKAQHENLFSKKHLT